MDPKSVSSKLLLPLQTGSRGSARRVEEMEGKHARLGYRESPNPNMRKSCNSKEIQMYTVERINTER